MSEILLNIADLTVEYGPVYSGLPEDSALQLNSLTLGRGQLLAICGPSGCGKTTLGRAVMGMLPAGARMTGSIRFAGQELQGLNARAWRQLRGKRITGLSQDASASLNPVLRVGTQLKQVGCSGQAATRLLQELGLPAGRNWLRAYPHQLSGGQCQRVALALALACDPDLLVADEPTAALDGTTAAEVLALMKGLARSRRMSVLLITHDLPMVEKQGLVSHHLGTPAGHRASAVRAGAPALISPGDTSAPALLTIKNLSVTYAGAPGPALVDVSMELQAGTTTAVIGPSGGGKSTLARAVMGLLPAASGQMALAGEPLSVNWSRRRLPIQLVLQDTFASLNPRRRVRQVLAESLAAAGRDLADAADCLAEVGLQPTFLERFPHQLSGGQRQRVALARALALSPQLIVLDEAFSALDIPVRDALLSQLLALQRQRQISYLMITHDTHRLAAVAHYTAVLEGGRLVNHGPTEQVLGLRCTTSADEPRR